MSVPRISAFARLANGNVAPDRIIEGQNTNLSRTMHGLAYDDLHDEIIVPGGAVGRHPRVPRRRARRRAAGARHPGRRRPDSSVRTRSNVDPVNGEILAGDPSGRAILVFDRLANGDVKPKRAIRGPKTQFREIVGVAVRLG